MSAMHRSVVERVGCRKLLSTAAPALAAGRGPFVASDAERNGTEREERRGRGRKTPTAAAAAADDDDDADADDASRVRTCTNTRSPGSISAR
jgi:hypothetical protein